MDKKKEEIINILKEYNQEHILDILDVKEKQGLVLDKVKTELYDQILGIDFEQIKELYENTKKESEHVNKKIESIKYLEQEKLTEIQKKEFEKNALEVIKSGQYAVLTMAGGQGTRLRT